MAVTQRPRTIEQLTAELEELGACRSRLARELTAAQSRLKKSTDARASLAAQGETISKALHEDIASTSSEVAGMRDALAITDGEIATTQAELAARQREAALSAAKQRIVAAETRARSASASARRAAYEFLAAFGPQMKELRSAHDAGREAVRLLTHIETDGGVHPTRVTRGAWAIDLFDIPADATLLIALEGMARDVGQR